jgi:transcription elongation factor Elf1
MSEILGRLPPKTLELVLLKCPKCKSHKLRKASVPGSDPPIAQVLCSSCHKIFIIEWPRGSKNPEQLENAPAVYVNKETKIYRSRVAYEARHAITKYLKSRE